MQMIDRGAELRDAASRSYDAIIIGGGINGAGIARDAAERGLRVLVLDKHDWGFGTTWRSTKLIHGGLRYLEHGEVPLVYESLRDRAALVRTAPHLVEPAPFLLPAYRESRRSLPVLWAGLTLYNLLALGGGLPWHRLFGPARTLMAEPRLRREGLHGALAYWDARVMLPERLCLENVQRARLAGAEAHSYLAVEAVHVARGRVHGVTAVDQFSGESVEFRAPLVVNAAGPWVDAVLRRTRIPANRIGGTRGTHLIVRFPSGGPRRPIYAEAPRDKRPLFIIPWRGVHLVGTTDVRVSGPDDVLPSDSEISYLMEALDHILPGERLSQADLWYAYAGIRPLPRVQNGPEGAITRRHHIVEHTADGYAGLVSIIGGKLSTYLALGQQVTEHLFHALDRDLPPSSVYDSPLVPGDWRPAPGNREEVRLWQIYGPRAEGIITSMHDNARLAEPVCPHSCETLAQVHHAVNTEGAVTAADVLLRRTPAGWGGCLGLDAAPLVSRILGERFGWDSAARAQAVQSYHEEVKRTFRPIAAVL